MNRSETKLLVENWRKVLNEGLYDSDSDVLLSEGFLQDLTSKLGNKVSTGLQTLAALAAIKFGGISDAGAYPKDPVHQQALNTVVKSLAVKFDVSEQFIRDNYLPQAKGIAADKTLDTLYWIQDAAMRSGDLERADEMTKIILKIKPKIKETENGRKYVPMAVFDKICKEYPFLLGASANAAKDVPLNDEVMNTTGAQHISGTSFSGTGFNQ